MTRKTPPLSIACLLTCGLVLAGCHAGGWKPGASADEELKMMDGNHDGTVSAEEHAVGAARMFQMIDANKDGNVTAQEMDAAHAAGGHDTGGMSSADKIKVIDGNGDGVLSAAEHAAGSGSMFTKSDTNGDGSLTADEIRAAHAAMMGKPGQ